MQRPPGSGSRPGVPEATSERDQVRILEAQLQELQEIARIGMWEWDLRHQDATWSPFMWRLHGLEAKSRRLDPRQVLDNVHPDDRARVAGIFFGPPRDIPSEFDYRIRIGNRTLQLHARTHVEQGPDGQPLRVVGTSQDVTAERQEEGRRELAFLASIVESSTDAIVTKDLDGTITSWNGAAEALFGYTAEEAVGRPVTLLIPPDRLPEESVILARIRRGEKVEPFETQRRRKDGRLVDVSVAISPLRDRDGRVTGASKVARDITERKRQLVRERAAMDAEIRRLDEMQRFRARFLNVAAHELKTPLTPIRLQLQLLEMRLKGQPETVQHALRVLTRSVERLRLLMDDVLDAARIQATQLKLRRERMDLGRVVYEALETYAPVAKKVDVGLHVELPAPAEVEGDQTRLLQVANNVLSNALKFTPPGGTVYVSLLRDGDDVVLSVRDTGRGLTEEQRGQLFQPFMQVHPDLEATSKGSGLGLFIVKAIVEQHGGSITLESPGPERGTTVTVRLPQRQPERPATPDPPWLEPAAPGPRPERPRRSKRGPRRREPPAPAGPAGSREPRASQPQAHPGGRDIH